MEVGGRGGAEGNACCPFFEEVFCKENVIGKCNNAI